MRAMGRIYAGWALSQTFYRREMWRGLGFKDLEDFLVRSWEAGFVRRDMHDLLAQLWTWQNGDISANDLYRGDLEMALGGIKAKVLLMPSATDLYFQTDDNRAELPHLGARQAGRDPLGVGPSRRQSARQSRGCRVHRRPGDGAARVVGRSAHCSHEVVLPSALRGIRSRHASIDPSPARGGGAVIRDGGVV